MAEVFHHLGYFPFCIKTGGLDETKGVNMSLRDAMFLYWKSQQAQVNISFSFLGHPIPNSGPEGPIIVTISENIDEQIQVYNNSTFLERACFQEPLRIANFDTASFPLNGFEYAITLFAESRPFDSNEYPNTTGTYPINPEDSIKVHAIVDMRKGGFYSSMAVGNPLSFSGQFNYDVPVNLNINGNQYSINCRARLTGYPFGAIPDPQFQFSASIEFT